MRERYRKRKGEWETTNIKIGVWVARFQVICNLAFRLLKKKFS